MEVRQRTAKTEKVTESENYADNTEVATGRPESQASESDMEALKS